MSRLVCTAMLVLGLCVSFSAVGCGTPENTVIEDTRSEAEIQKEMEDYDNQLEEQAASNVTQ